MSVEIEGVYTAPDRLQVKMLLTLWGASQHRSDVIQIGELRYVRSQNYNQVSGQRVVTAGWQEERVSGPEGDQILGTVGLDYATRFVADQGGIEPPDVRRCGESTIRFLQPDAADNRTHLVVRVQSSEVAADGVPCRDGVLMTTTHWIVRVSFRPWRELPDAAPLEGLLYWRGQTVYSDYDGQFDIEAPG